MAGFRRFEPILGKVLFTKHISVRKRNPCTEIVKNLKSAIFECGPRSVRFAKQKEARFSISLLNELGLEKDIIARDKSHPSSKYRFLWERLAQYSGMCPPDGRRL